jgi:hypothetical protein
VSLTLLIGRGVPSNMVAPVPQRAPRTNRALSVRCPYTDSCYTRAPTMDDQIAADGYSCGKVWNYASGHPDATLTYYNDKVPGGAGHWVYHVAPIGPVTQPDGSVQQMMVIDPSTESGPVTVDKWKADQHDPGARTVQTDASLYYLAPDGKSYGQTPDDNVNAFRATAAPATSIVWRCRRS